MEAVFEGRRHYIAGERISSVVTLKCPKEIIEGDDFDNVAIHVLAAQIVGVFTFNAQWCSPRYVAPAKKGKNEPFPPVLPVLGLFL